MTNEKMTNEKAIADLEEVLTYLEKECAKSDFVGKLMQKRIESMALAVEALENQEILLELLAKIGTCEINNGVSDYVCDALSCTGFCDACDGRSARDCYMEYLRIKRRERNDG